MPINGYSVGRDVTLKVVLSGGRTLSIPGLTNFKKKPDLSDQKVMRMDGRVDHLVFPGGWSGSFELDRTDDSVDTFMADYENAYYNNQNMQAATLTETIIETDGTASRFRYTGVMLKPTDMGDAAGDKTIKQTVEFLASRRLKVV